MKDKRLIFIQASVLESVIKDVVTFGSLALLLLFNYKILNGDWYISVFIMFIWIMSMTARGSLRRFDTKEELIDFLNKTK